MKKLNFSIFKYLNIGIFYLLLVAGCWLSVVSTAHAATIQASTQPSFEANLTNSLILQTGKGNPTFTRATTAYVTDWEGLMKPVLSGEARFTGARRVANILTSPTENFSAWNNAIGGTGSNPTVTGGKTDPLGGNTAFRLQTFLNGGTSGGDFSGISSGTSIPLATGNSYQRSIWVKSNTGSSQVFTFVQGGAVQKTATTQWTRVALEGGELQNLNGFTLGSRGSFQGDIDILIWHPMFEIVTGQTNQNPSEYVSCNTLSAPYHGAGVDCVKYFNTKNGNTVASNIVTEATGQKITSSAPGVFGKVADASGPLGYLAEGARTNLQVRSEQLDLWNVLTGVTVTPDSTLAPTGTSTADTVVDANNGDDRAQYNTTVANDSVTYTFSIYIKKTSGNAHYAGLSLNFTVGTPTAGAIVVNTNTGAITASSGAGNSSCVNAGNYWRCQFSAANNSTGNTTMYIQVRPAYNTDGTITFASATTGSNIFWGAQIEAAGFASSYIPTTSGSVQRVADNLTYQESGNISMTAGTAYAEARAEALQRGWVIGYNSIGNLMNKAVASNPSTIETWDGTLSLTAGNTVDWTAGVKAVVAWQTGGNKKLSLNGVQVNTNAYDGNWGSPSSIRIGTLSTGDYQLYGTVRNVKIWPRALTDTQLMNMTGNSTVVSAQSIAPKTTMNVSTSKNPSIQNGLIGLWSFDGKDMNWATNKALDGSGQGNDGTLINMSTSSSPTKGQIGQALRFGGSRYIDAGNNSSLNITGNSITIAMWVKPSGTGYCLVDKDRNTAYHTQLINQNAFQFRVNTAVLSGSTILTPGRWYHLTATYDGSFMRVYVNGVSDATPAALSGNINSSAQNVLIGKCGDGYNIAGDMDDVRIYNRALSVSEITALYRAGGGTVVNATRNTSSAGGLVGLWSFDGKDMNWTTNKVLDRSGQGNDGVLTNMSTSSSPIAGKIGQALKFNGINTNISITSVSSLNFGTGDFTVSQWVNFSNLNDGANGLISKDNYPGGATYNGWLMNLCAGCSPSGIGLETRNLVGGVGPDTHARYAASNFSIGQWYHLVGVRNSGTLYLYVNGVLRSTTVEGSATNVTNSQNLTIGYLSAGSPQWFRGKIDDTRVYNRALSPIEVVKLYNSGR